MRAVDDAFLFPYGEIQILGALQQCDPRSTPRLPKETLNQQDQVMIPIKSNWQLPKPRPCGPMGRMRIVDAVTFYQKIS